MTQIDDSEKKTKSDSEMGSRNSKNKCKYFSPLSPFPLHTCFSFSLEQTLNPGAKAQVTWNAAHIKLWQVWLLINPCCYSPLDVVLEATAFSLTSVRLEHFTMGFSTFFFSPVVELWDWASMMTSHYFSSLRTNT